MDVWVTWCKRTAKCRYCDKDIEKATAMVVGKIWRKGSDNRRWNIKLFWHLQCWVTQATEYLVANPYVARGYRGGPKLELSEEDARTRYLLLRRKAELEQRKRKLVSPYPDRLLVEARLDEKIVGIMEEIVKVGGIPKKWLKTLTTTI